MTVIALDTNVKAMIFVLSQCLNHLVIFSGQFTQFFLFFFESETHYHVIKATVINSHFTAFSDRQEFKELKAIFVPCQSNDTRNKVMERF